MMCFENHEVIKVDAESLQHQMDSSNEFACRIVALRSSLCVIVSSVVVTFCHEKLMKPLSQTTLICQKLALGSATGAPTLEQSSKRNDFLAYYLRGRKADMREGWKI